MRSMFERETRPALRFSMKSNSLYINRATMNSLENKPFVQFLWNGNSKMLLIAGRAEQGRDCFAMERISGRLDKDGIGSEYVFTRKVFADAISLRMGWERDKSYKVFGGYSRRIRMVVFPLEDAQVINELDETIPTVDAVAETTPPEESTVIGGEVR